MGPKSMRKYNISLRELHDRYMAGKNIMKLLKASDGTNSIKTIEIAHDLQSGSYVRAVFNNMDTWKRFTSELGSILQRFVRPER